jgi:hypothetical protein
MKTYLFTLLIIYTISCDSQKSSSMVTVGPQKNAQKNLDSVLINSANQTSNPDTSTSVTLKVAEKDQIEKITLTGSSFLLITSDCKSKSIVKIQLVSEKKTKDFDLNNVEYGTYYLSPNKKFMVMEV